jgi:hypothetical protein
MLAFGRIICFKSAQVLAEGTESEAHAAPEKMTRSGRSSQNERLRMVASVSKQHPSDKLNSKLANHL